MSDLGEGKRMCLSQQPAKQSGDSLTFTTTPFSELFVDSMGLLRPDMLSARDDLAIRTVHFGRGGRNLQIQSQGDAVPPSVPLLDGRP